MFNIVISGDLPVSVDLDDPLSRSVTVRELIGREVGILAYRLPRLPPREVKRLHFLSRAFNRIQLFRGYRKGVAVPPGLPYMADIEPTTRCNFACTMCQTTTWKRPRGDMSPEQFIHILDSIPTLLKIKLVGAGEPLMNPHFFEMARIAGERKIEVKTTTNGSLLDQARRKDLLSCGLTHVDVSLDGATAETQETIRRGSHFDEIVENVRALMQERGQPRRPEIRIWFVAQQANLRELPDMVTLCHALGVDQLAVQWSLVSYGNASLEDVVGSQRVLATDAAASIAAEANAIADRLGLRVSIPMPRADKEPKLCGWPWKRTFITHQGYVCPCCFVNDPHVVEYGNIFEQDFLSIWRGSAYQEMRRRLAECDPPSYCIGCDG